MKVGLYFNKNYIDENKPYLERIKRVLSYHFAQCRIVSSLEDLDGLDVLMVLGGDGTILMVASECALRGIKIIGINYGHMGFLAEFEPEKIDQALEIVCSGNFRTVKRSMLKIVFAGKTYYALNDLVIQRSTSGNAFSNTINLRAEIDGSTVDNFSADGLIVSTPTGSTAYSLAAGGSVLTPELDAFIMTPICAHSLHSRPIVFSDRSTLKIYQIDKRSEINLIVDGKAVAAISDFKEVQVTKSEYCTEFIVSDENDFFDKLLIKLNIWSK